MEISDGNRRPARDRRPPDRGELLDGPRLQPGHRLGRGLG